MLYDISSMQEITEQMLNNFYKDDEFIKKTTLQLKKSKKSLKCITQINYYINSQL